MGRYLAPEVVAGQPASRSDDVYSLGAILFEMLTGQQVPMYPATGLATTIDQAVVAAEGEHLSAELATLLKRTLCTRDQRVPDVVSWHKSLAKLMADAQLSPTTFNLAFFLHSLFRNEIERESRELESEKTQAVSLGASAPELAAEPSAAAADATLRDAGPIREDTGVLREKYGMEEKKGGPPMGVILGGIAAVVVLGVGGYFLLGRGGAKPPATATPPAQDTPAQAAPAAPAGPTPEELQAQIAKMVSDQSKQMEAGLKAKYDEQVKALEKQLNDAQKARQVAAQAPPITIANPQAQRTVPTPAAAAPSEAKPAVTTAKEPATPTEEITRPPAASAAATPEPKPAAPVTQPRAPEPAPQPSVRAGDLVSSGPGVVPPRLTHQALLHYPPLAKRLRKEATVVVRVLVDENGRPADVQPTGEKAGYGMEGAAEAFARECQWAPATKTGVRVKMWYELKVVFKL